MREMPLPDVGLGAMILRRAALVPELPAISFEGETLCYAAFAERIRRLASALRKAFNCRPRPCHEPRSQ